MQILAFRHIVTLVVEFRTTPLLDELRPRNEIQGAPIEAIMFGWRRLGVDYDAEWLHYYRLVWFCLTDNPVMRAIRQAPTLPNWNEYSDIIESCS